MLAAGLAGGMVAGLIGSAQAQEASRVPVGLDGLSSAGQLLAGVHYSEVAALAEELNFDVSVLFADGSPPTLLLKDELGFVLVGQPVNCSGSDLADRCNGLLLYFGILGNPLYRNSMMANANRFNGVQYYGRGHITPDSNAVMTRMVLGDHGITRGQLATELFTTRNAALVFVRVLGARVVDTTLAGNALVGSSPFSGGNTLHGGLPGQPDLWAGEGRSAFEDLMPRWEKLGLASEILNDPRKLLGPEAPR